MTEGQTSRPQQTSRPAESPSDPELMARIREYQSQLRRLTSELSLAEARERQAIASDLHDHIGQALAYVSQKVTMLQGNAVFCGMEDDFSEILAILQQTIRYTRNLTVEISPPVLYELGLAAATDWLAERTANRHHLQIVSTQTGAPQIIAEDIKVFLFKAIQELLTNVAKHARARSVTIETAWQPGAVTVTIVDDGVGFDTSGLLEGRSPDGCFGLFSIRERLSYVGGAVAIESSPGHGTKVTLTSPFQVSSGAADD